MSDRAPLLLVIALGALLPHGAVLARDWPDVPLPEGAQGEWVSRHMVYNGLNMRASRFTVAAKADAVEAFYRQAWKGEVVRNTLGRKTILGRADGDHFITVELTAKGSGTQGQIGIMEMAKPKGTPGNGFAKMPGTRVYEDIVYLDTPQRSRSLNMHNRNSPYQNERFYARELAARGYVREPGSMACESSSAMCISYFIKGDDRIVVSLNRQGDGTSIVALDM